MEYFEDLSNQLKGLVSSVTGTELGGVLGAIIIGWVLVLAFQFVCFPFAIWRIRREVINKNSADSKYFAEIEATLSKISASAAQAAASVAAIEAQHRVESAPSKTAREGHPAKPSSANVRADRLSAAPSVSFPSGHDAADDPVTLALIAALEAKNKN